MHYLLCALWLIGGGPKYAISGQFQHTDHGAAWLSAEICHEGDCKNLKLNGDFEFGLRLKPGSYEVHFVNNWRQEIILPIDLQSDTVLTMDAGDFQPRANYPVWEAFLRHGNLTIAERTESNGHYWERVLTFEHIQGAVVVEVDDPAARVGALEMLSPLETFQLEDFLRKVDLFDGGEGCDAPTLYLMQAGEETFIIEDSSCELLHLDTILYDLYVRNYVSQDFPLYSN